MTAEMCLYAKCDAMRYHERNICLLCVADKQEESKNERMLNKYLNIRNTFRMKRGLILTLHTEIHELFLNVTVAKLILYR